MPYRSTTIFFIKFPFCGIYFLHGNNSKCKPSGKETLEVRKMLLVQLPLVTSQNWGTEGDPSGTLHRCI